MNSGTTTDIWAVFSLDEATGYVGGDLGLIQETTDGIQHWNSQNSGTSNRTSDIQFTNLQHGYAVGTRELDVNGFIPQSTDAGLHWQTIFAAPPLLSGISSSFGLSSLFFTSSSTGYLVGAKGMILKTTNAGVTFVTNPTQEFRLTGTVLSPTYPNRFNPSTTIQYALPSRTRVTLTVFNTLGQQIGQLVDGEMEAGYHEVKFDGSGLSGGVYFYRLQAGTYVQARKLLLVR